MMCIVWGSVVWPPLYCDLTETKDLPPNPTLTHTISSLSIGGILQKNEVIYRTRITLALGAHSVDATSILFFILNFEICLPTLNFSVFGDERWRWRKSLTPERLEPWSLKKQVQCLTTWANAVSKKISMKILSDGSFKKWRNHCWREIVDSNFVVVVVAVAVVIIVVVVVDVELTSLSFNSSR